MYGFRPYNFIFVARRVCINYSGGNYPRGWVGVGHLPSMFFAPNFKVNCTFQLRSDNLSDLGVNCYVAINWC